MIRKIKLFKTLLLLLIIGFLYIFYDYSISIRNQSENGRYVFSGSSPDYFIDTRTGKVYQLKFENIGYEIIQKNILP